MSWWQSIISKLSGANSSIENATDAENDHLLTAAKSLRQLINDPKVPAKTREALAADYAQVQSMLEKIERGDLHIAIFGRVSVGKSALANALLGRDEFSVGVLHGTTQVGAIRSWQEVSDSGVHITDTPGINELSGEERERMAHEIAQRSDLVVFVVDGDMTQVEQQALKLLAAEQRPVLLVLNKSDRYSDQEQQSLLQRLREHATGIVHAENVVAAAAQPAPKKLIRVDAHGEEQISQLTLPPDIDALRERIFDIVQREGKTLAALNASLFAGKLSDAVARSVAQSRRELAENLIQNYCLAKGVAVALNPVPVADLLAAASLDVALVIHLSKLYGLPLTRSEAGSLLATIVAQLAALMGAVWGVHLVASALKGLSAGLSTFLTAGAQGALAWYATYLVGRAAEHYLVRGKSWGEQGPKRAVQKIVDSLDRNSILREAREQILQRLKQN